MVSIAVLGYGTIGSGVVEVLEKNSRIIEERAGDEIAVKYVLDLREFPGDTIEDKLVHDYQVIRDDADVRIVVEAMGGVDPAYDFAKEALLSGKHFATSNKALIAAHGAELIALAKEKSLSCLFGASVGGGIPILRPLVTCLTADVIEEISGILNGTTNYMMSKMSDEGLEFEEVLKDAQEKGYAEANPKADIEGHDACRKIAILTSLISGERVDFEDIDTEGITDVDADDFKYAAAMEKKIRLLASAYRKGDSYCAVVAPFMIGKEHPLYSVDGVFNAVFVRGNMLGDAMFYGSGAGKLPTASAVAADVIDIVRHIDSHISMDWTDKKHILADAGVLINRYFVRCSAGEDDICTAFGRVEYVTAEGIEGERAFVTEEMDGNAFAAAAAKLPGVIKKIRIK